MQKNEIIKAINQKTFEAKKLINEINDLKKLLSNYDNPIPLGLNIDIIKDVYINWIAEKEFYTQFKVYCDPNGCFDAMIQNKSNLCMMFQFNIYSLSNVKTKMRYKIWISKRETNVYEIINTNSTLINSEIIKDKE